MTPPPVLSLAAQRAYEQVQHLDVDGDAEGWPVAVLCSALAAPFDQVYDLVAATARPYEILLDIDECPAYALPYLAMFNGVPSATLIGLDEDQQRATIRDGAGKRRGTPKAIVATAQTYLTGTKTVLIFERDTKSTHYTVVTRTSETPDAAAVLRALTAQKPARLQFDYILSDLELWIEIDPATPTWATMSSTLTWADLDTGTHVT